MRILSQQPSSLADDAEKVEDTMVYIGAGLPPIPRSFALRIIKSGAFVEMLSFHQNN